jgi:lysophospholipase L1-like esterase
VGYSYALATTPGFPPDRVKSWFPSSKDLFTRGLEANVSSVYDLGDWLPQVVLISSGLNDWKSTPPEYSMDDWLAQALAFLKQVSTSLKQPTIILLEWPEDVGLNGATYATLPDNLSAQYIEAMNDLYAEALVQGIPNIEFLHINNTAYSDYKSWCLQHPSLQAHLRVAEQVVDLIAESVPDWSNTGSVTMRADQSWPDPNTSLYCAGCDKPSPAPGYSPASPTGNSATAG